MTLLALDIPAIKRRPALRLVSTHDMSRDEWLGVRKQGIGSSDAAAAVGLNPYKSPLELWMDKTGRKSPSPVSQDDEESPTYWGTLLEPIVAAHYTKRTGNRVRKVNAVLQHRDPDKSWMLANIDREIVGVSEVQILECKTAGINGARLWKEGVPEYVQLQVQHQLAVTGKAAADVAVLLGGQQLDIHRIARDGALIEQLIQLEREFWHYVETDTPPPADGSESADRALRLLYPSDNGQSVDFSQDSRLSAVFSDFQAIRDKLMALQQVESQLKQTLQEAIGSASGGIFQTGSVTWKKAKDIVVLDVARLLQEQPSLLTQYPLTRTGSRRFLLA